jgi:HEPN domain-containing protein
MAEQLPEQLPDPAASGELDQELLLNDFAIRSFRHVGDGDYIAARMASRAQLVAQFLWSSQQALEKYLKCILLLRRIPANSGTHSLTDLLNKIDAPGAFAGALTRGTQSFIARLDQYGRFSRYLEVSNVGFGKELLTLDRAVWEIRRYCELDSTTNAALELRNGQRAPRVRLEGDSWRVSSTTRLTQHVRPCCGRTASSGIGKEERFESVPGSGPPIRLFSCAPSCSTKSRSTCTFRNR